MDNECETVPGNAPDEVISSNSPLFARSKVKPEIVVNQLGCTEHDHGAGRKRLDHLALNN